MLKSASTNAYASSSRLTIVGTIGISSGRRRSGISSNPPTVELNSPSFLPPRCPSSCRRPYSSLATISSVETPSVDPPLSPYVQKKLARQARLQPLARKPILPPSLKNTTLPSSVLLQHPIITLPTPTPTPPPTVSPPYPLVSLFPPIFTPEVVVVVDPPASPSPSSSSPRPVKVSSAMTVAELDQHYKWTDEQVVVAARNYTKKVLKGNPSVQVMRRRLLVQKLSEMAATEKARPTRSELERDDADGAWKQWMGLRGVPVISKWPTTHPTKAVGIWGVKQTSELETGDPYPPSSSWIGATAVTSSTWRTIRQSSPLHIQFIRRLPSLASARTVQGPTLAPTSSQLPHIPSSFQPPIRVGLPPIYTLSAYPPHPTSTSTAARTAAYLSTYDADPTARRRKIEVSARYCSDLLRLASAPDVTDETREMVEKYMMLKMRKAGLVGWEDMEGTSEEVMGKKNWRRGKRERVVVEMDVKVGKKSTHPTAPRRNKAKRKMREALKMVLMDEHAKGSKSMLKWRGYTYVMRPTAQLTQIPMDRLTEYVRASLMKICSKFNAPVAGGSQQLSLYPPRQQQQQQGRIDPRPPPQQVKPPRGGLGPSVAGARGGGGLRGGSGAGGQDWRAGR